MHSLSLSFSIYYLSPSRPKVPKSSRFVTPFQPTACCPRVSSLYLPAIRQPTTWRDKRTADTIIYFANVLQNCRYSFSVQSIQFSAPRVRLDVHARSTVHLYDCFIVSRRYNHRWAKCNFSAVIFKRSV